MKIEGMLKSIEGHLREPLPMSADEFNAALKAFRNTTHTFSGRRLTPGAGLEEVKALDGLTEREQKLARGMAAAIWGIDLDETQSIEARSQCKKLAVPVLIPRSLLFVENADWIEQMNAPRYTSETIELDRWLVPWRLKAGYSAKINMLVYRLEAAQ